MKRFLVGSLFLIVLPISGVASENSEFYDSIRTLETLTVVLDGRASEHQFTDQGSEVLSCFPCKAGEVSQVCP
ncbi:hypothetical protein [uncultured Vibrio sp.]|uniref:hypothetical protein n=1 Tax=uncultured Vibrio sp. TaxID=114054 RepID=UPI000B319897|nr:hypothetical protein [uncultured Vibrio sp.]